MSHNYKITIIILQLVELGNFDTPDTTLCLYTSLLCIDSYSMKLPTDDVARSITEGVSNPLVGVTAGTGLPLKIKSKFQN